jgi:antitoxin HicB
MKRSTRKPREFRASIEANEHGGYMVTVPALPGLVTEDKNLEHVRTMAKDAIQFYIDGLKKAKEFISDEQITAQVKISVVA